MEFSEVKVVRRELFNQLEKISSGSFSRNVNIDDYDTQSDMYGNLFVYETDNRYMQVDINWNESAGPDFRFDHGELYGGKDALIVSLPQSDINYAALFDLFCDWSIENLPKERVITKHRRAFDPTRLGRL